MRRIQPPCPSDNRSFVLILIAVDDGDATER